ncbi:Hypothetical protein NTJ_03142 [Nesidiocoris tenuis]|uniref:Uncharacterized protein n=1 Tax=Nesidiocoris tenuis TaxID=355587 RepID=A0ABN7AG45_9HEMI|nr:Hypothetical protein NTJ_03142 [Nesidiocoris tenuis]
MADPPVIPLRISIQLSLRTPRSPELSRADPPPPALPVRVRRALLAFSQISPRTCSDPRPPLTSDLSLTFSLHLLLRRIYSLGHSQTITVLPATPPATPPRYATLLPPARKWAPSPSC